MKARGMTLLEVMVALLIFALTGTAIIKAASDHISGIGQIEDITFATWVANNRLTQATLEQSWPPKNNLKGEAEMAGKTWYWQQKILKTTDKDLQAIEVSVGLDDSYQNTILYVTGYVSNPEAN